MASKRQKKVVQVESATGQAGSSGSGKRGDGPVWTATPEAKSKTLRLRLIAAALWAVAIGVELYGIFGVLGQDDPRLWLLIVVLVVTGILAITGSLLWKQANRLDPASRDDTVRFFVQNQLGAIVAVIAFLPLIALILLNKDLDPKEKAIAGGIGAVIAALAIYVGIDFDPPSQEQYAYEENIVEALTGENLVFWTASGRVFHVCQAVPDVNRESQDGTIYQGTVAAAHEAGKERLVSYWDRQAVSYCGYTQEEVDVVKAGLDDEDYLDRAPDDADQTAGN